MICDHCKEREATMHVAVFEKSGKKEWNLCSECAQKLGVMPMNPFSFGDLFQQVTADIPAEISCSSCGTTLGELKRTGLVGCEHCYEDLRMGIMPIIRNVQKNVQHIGRTPIGYEAGTLVSQCEDHKVDEELEHLKEELAEAVKSENFEQAAVLRDQIKDFKHKEENA